VAFGGAMLLTGGAHLQRRTGRSRTLAASACLALLVLIVLLAGWVGVDSLAGRFVEVDWREWNGRRGSSLDAFATFQRHWLTGTGVNTYQFANLVYQRRDTASFQSSAHNDYAQLAAEGGLLVVIPAAICLVQLVRAVRRRLREDRASPAAYSLRVGAVASLMAIGLQETVDFSLQIPGNALLFAVVCGIALHAEPRMPDAPGRGR
jgi:O-antigen ligase